MVERNPGADQPHNQHHDEGKGDRQFDESRPPIEEPRTRTIVLRSGPPSLRKPYTTERGCIRARFSTFGSSVVEDGRLSDVRGVLYTSLESVPTLLRREIDDCSDLIRKLQRVFGEELEAPAVDPESEPIYRGPLNRNGRQRP